MKFFVWVEHNGRCYPQKWEEDHTSPETGKKRDTIEKFKLTAEEADLPIDELAARYPLKEKV